MHHHNSTHYCNTETVFIYTSLPPDQHHISDVAKWRKGGGLCISMAYAVTRCLFIHLLRSCVLSKRVHIFSVFSPSGSHTVLAFPYQTLRQYSYRHPPPNVGKNCSFDQYLASGSTTGLASSVVNSFDCGVKFITADDDDNIVYDSKPRRRFY